MSHVDLKVVLLGKEYGGKTSLVERYLYDRFDASTPYQNTIGAAYGAKQIAVRNRRITLGIWDTAGSERYEAMSRIYYRGAGAAIVCFDLTDRESYQKAKFWVNELRKHEEQAQTLGLKNQLHKAEAAVELWFPEGLSIGAKSGGRSSSTINIASCTGLVTVGSAKAICVLTHPSCDFLECLDQM
ncbi:ras-related protein Rab-24-like isoform X3 [Dermacentor albipictus]|uniref:ras-related protein Rab-24-like isoform X3 n=1 Tax=Dermacentor albipictus TaxID=60249 RepID=UPI0038FD17A6